MPKSLEDLSQRFRTMAGATKALLAVVGLFTVVAMSWMLFHDFGGRYRVVAQDLADAAQAHALVDRMVAGGVQARVAEGGRAVEVHENQIALALRVATQKNAMPRASVAMLEKVAQQNSILISSEERRQVLLRSLEARLEENLKTYEMVDNASVSLSVPPSDGFAHEHGQAKASVILTFRPKFRPSRRLLGTVQTCVSHAVDGLRPDQVSVSDNLGRDLTAIPEEAADDEAESGGAMLRERCELDLGRRVTMMLAPLFGQENLTVTVTAQMRAPRAWTPPRGASPAAGARLASFPSQEPVTSLAPAGLLEDASRIARLSVSVLIDSREFKDGTITEKLRRDAEQLASSAAGCRPDRGDVVSVVAQRCRVALPRSSPAGLLATFGDSMVSRAPFIWFGVTLVLLLALVGTVTYAFPSYELAAPAAAVRRPPARQSTASAEQSLLLGLTAEEIGQLMAECQPRSDLASVLAGEGAPMREFLLNSAPQVERDTLRFLISIQSPADPETHRATTMRLVKRVRELRTTDE